MASPRKPFDPLKEAARERSRRFYQRHLEEERERNRNRMKDKRATPEGKAALNESYKRYRQTENGKKKHSEQESRRHQGKKNDPIYRAKRKQTQHNWASKDGPAQQHRKEQAREYRQQEHVKKRVKWE